MLIEDGVLVYRNKAPTTSRKNHKIEKLLWPANLLDLNSIENVWKMLKDCMQKKCRLKNQTEMWMSVEGEWMVILPSKLESLVASIPERIKAILAVEDGHTCW